MPFYLFWSPLVMMLLLGGCTLKDSKKDRDYNNLSERVVEKREQLVGQIEQQRIKKQTISIENSKYLTTVLKELGKMEEKVYFLKSKDMKVPESKYQIKSFESLNHYLELTTDHRLVQTNPNDSDGLVLLELKNIHEANRDLKEIPLALEGHLSLEQMLDIVSRLTGFNVIIDAKEVATEDMKAKISFQGSSVKDFLDYLSYSMNLFVDINHKKKLITFSRYKTGYFHLIASNLRVSESTEGKILEATDDTDSDGGNNLLATDVTLDTFAHLKENLDEIINQNNARDEKNYYTLNKTNGQVVVYATFNAMKQVDRLIAEFNEEFSKQIKVTLESYEVLLSNDYTIGSDLLENHILSLDSPNEKIFATTNFLNGGVASIVDSSENPALKASSFIPDADGTYTPEYANMDQAVTANGKVSQSNALFNSINQYGKLISNRKNSSLMVNNIPYVQNIITSTTYLKTINKTEEVVDGIKETTYEPEPENIYEGFSLTVIPKVNEDLVSLNILPNFTKLLNMSTQEFDEEVIALPKTETHNFNANVVLRNGERRLIGSVAFFDEAENYKGVVPLEHFIVAGSSDTSYVRREIVFVVSVEIVDE